MSERDGSPSRDAMPSIYHQDGGGERVEVMNGRRDNARRDDEMESREVL